MKKYIFPIILLSFISIHAEASIRVDLEDRKPEEVLEKSLYLANQETYYSTVTGAITFETAEGPIIIGSGIALDNKTVLTAAHLKFLGDIKDFQFVLNPNVHPKVNKKKNIYKISSPVIFHPHYKLQVVQDLAFEEIKGEWYADSILLKDISSFTYPMFEKSQLSKHTDFAGVDLVILKLDIPLGDSLHFPEILNQDVKVVNSNAVCMGYGAMHYNYQNPGPIPVTNNPKKAYRRHLVSSKVTGYENNASGFIFYGSYKGILVNGNESFISNSSMLKTEGLPVSGDSGGPLFIQHENKYKLCGITSSTWSLCTDPMTELSNKEIFKDFIQPVFPTWVDIRPYKEWIMEHMERKVEVKQKRK